MVQQNTLHVDHHALEVNLAVFEPLCQLMGEREGRKEKGRVGGGREEGRNEGEREKCSNSEGERGKCSNSSLSVTMLHTAI